MFSISSLTNTLTYKKIQTCNSNSFPSQTPIIYGLSQYTSSIQDTYTTIYITGQNFVYGENNTQIYFISNTTPSTIQIIPTLFYSSTYVSFVIPSSQITGTYTLKVAVKSTISGGNGTGMLSATTILFSNPQTYILTV